MHFYRKKLLLIFRKIIRIFSGYGIGRFYSFRIIKNFMISFLTPKFIEVQRHKMFLDSMDSLNLSINEFYEPFETNLIKKEIKKGNIVLDIGANIGYYSLIFARLVGKKGEVFAFEPEPTNFALLKKNVEINGYKNVILEQKAISNKNEKLMLYLSEDNKGDHRIYNSHEGRRAIEVEAIRLDDYFKNYNKNIDFIKIDIQGAESGVIQGMSRVLKKNKTVKIITEFWPAGLKRFGIEPEEYLELLLKYGFRLYSLNELKEKLEPVNVSHLLKTYTLEKENFTNLLCIKGK